MGTSFKELASLCEELEKTKSRLKLASLTADFLRKVDPEEIKPAVYLILGRVFPEWDSRSLHISWKAMWKITRSIANLKEQEYEKIFSDSVDAGDAIMRIFEKKFEESCGKLKGAGLSILNVYQYFEGIASTKGKGSRERKEYLLHELFLKADALESKYIAQYDQFRCL